MNSAASVGFGQGPQAPEPAYRDYRPTFCMRRHRDVGRHPLRAMEDRPGVHPGYSLVVPVTLGGLPCRSEEHTSELQSLMRISYAVFCLKKKKTPTTSTN